MTRRPPQGANPTVARAKIVARLRASRHTLNPPHTPNDMNEDQLKGQWEQLKGKFKRAWAELTDDDFLRAEGSIDKMYGIIQERFGDTKADIQRKLNQI
jgi:uncharacterized protein YjbJ (UPF0337 family)